MKKISFKIMNYTFALFFSASVFSSNKIIVEELKNSDGSKWFIEMIDDNYKLKYINSSGVIFSNNFLITSGIEKNTLMLNSESSGDVSIIMLYPRDTYEYKFTSGESPGLISACKQTKLTSTDAQQAFSIIRLCSKSADTERINLSNVDADKILSPDVLFLDGEVKTTIGAYRAFLYEKDGKPKPDKSYLVRGERIEVLTYNKSLLKIRYFADSGSKLAWVNFRDIL